MSIIEVRRIKLELPKYREVEKKAYKKHLDLNPIEAFILENYIDNKEEEMEWRSDLVLALDFYAKNKVTELEEKIKRLKIINKPKEM